MLVDYKFHLIKEDSKTSEKEVQVDFYQGDVVLTTNYKNEPETRYVRTKKLESQIFIFPIDKLFLEVQQSLNTELTKRTEG